MRLPLEITTFLLESNPAAVDKAEVKNVSGGCINQCYQIEFGGKKFFLKVNSASKYPGMFESESKGLKLLFQTKTFTVPEPLINFARGDQQYLLLSFLEKGQQKNFQTSSGVLLAELHRNTSQRFGLDHNNYIGSLKQENTFSDTFSEFFTVCRIEPLLRTAIDSGAAEKSMIKNFERLYAILNDIIPAELPALIHGDLWGGNIMSSLNGPAIFDPAVYYGHRESDIAMTKLFGGFDNDFYTAYNNEYPLAKGWEERADIFNLYPLLVHVILFGGGYYPEVKSIVKRF